jgi:hypothetical protein
MSINASERAAVVLTEKVISLAMGIAEASPMAQALLRHDLANILVCETEHKEIEPIVRLIFDFLEPK